MRLWPFLPRRRQPLEVLVDAEHAVLYAERPLDGHQVDALADCWRSCVEAAPAPAPRCRLCGRVDDTVHTYLRLSTWIPGEPPSPSAVVAELCELCTADTAEADRIARLMGMQGA